MIMQSALGADVKDVQTRLGHSDISTTLQTYTHATDTMANHSVEIFEKAHPFDNVSKKGCQMVVTAQYFQFKKP